MTANYALSAGLLGGLLAALILYLIRRDQLYLRDAIFWLATALASIMFGLFPALIDWMGNAAGVAYAPALILALVCSVLTIKALLGDIALTALRRDVRRLNQRVALIDAERQTKQAPLGE
jgi:hypothetical protein